jgi:hypothetical protein
LSNRRKKANDICGLSGITRNDRPAFRIWSVAVGNGLEAREAPLECALVLHVIRASQPYGSFSRMWTK